MVAYIKSDLDFILEQIKIAEAHALYVKPTEPGQAAVRAEPERHPPRFPPTTSPGACARSMAPTTTCCPARSSGARPTSSFPN